MQSRRMELELMMSVAGTFRHTHPAFSKLEKSLVDVPWIMGDQFSLADISWIPTHFVLVGCGYDFNPYPNVVRWVASVQERESYHKGILDWCEDFSKV